MNFQKLLDRSGNGKSSTKELGEGQPEAVLFLNPSISDVLEALQELKKTFEDHFANLTDLIHTLEDKISKLSSGISDLVDSIDSLNAKVDDLQIEIKKLKSDSIDQEAMNEVRTEAKRFRDNWVRNEQIGSIRKQIEIFDDLNYLDGPDDISTFQQAVLESLLKLKVEKIEREGSNFDPDLMKATEIVQVNDPSQDMEIQEVLKEGFQFSDGTIIRPMQVQVSRCTKEVHHNE